MLKRKGAMTDQSGTPFLWRGKLLSLLLAVAKGEAAITNQPRSTGPSACQVAVAATCRYKLL